MVKYNSPHGRSDILASRVGVIIEASKQAKYTPLRSMTVLWTNGKKGSYPDKYLEVIA